MHHLSTNPTVSIGNSAPIALVSADYADGIIVRRHRCPRCTRELGPIPRAKIVECPCGFVSTSTAVDEYYVEPCFIRLEWAIYERDFLPLVARMQLSSDLVALTFRMLENGAPWTDLCDGCKFSSHELASPMHAIMQDAVKLHFSSGQIYWGNDRKTLNENPRKFRCLGSPA